MHRNLLGLSQLRLAALANTSRTTINRLENGVLDNLNYSTVVSILSILGLELSAVQTERPTGALEEVAAAVSKSHANPITSQELLDIFASGTVPEVFRAHVETLLTELPTALVVRATREAALEPDCTLRYLWRNLHNIGMELGLRNNRW